MLSLANNKDKLQKRRSKTGRKSKLHCSSVKKFWSLFLIMNMNIRQWKSIEHVIVFTFYSYFSRSILCVEQVAAVKVKRTFKSFAELRVTSLLRTLAHATDTKSPFLFPHCRLRYRSPRCTMFSTCLDTTPYHIFRLFVGDFVGTTCKNMKSIVIPCRRGINVSCRESTCLWRMFTALSSASCSTVSSLSPQPSTRSA